MYRQYIYKLLWIFLTVFLAIYSSDINILLTLITFDGIFTAIKFAFAFINKNLNEKQTVNESESLYIVPCNVVARARGIVRIMINARKIFFILLGFCFEFKKVMEES